MWFNFQQIPTHIAQSPYFQSMVSSTQKVDPSIQPQILEEMHGIHLADQVHELKYWVKSFKKSGTSSVS